MKIILLPPSMEPDNRMMNTSVPSGLLSLHAALKDTRDVDCQLLNFPPYYPSRKELAGTAKAILAHSPDIVGLSTWCHSYPAQIRLAKELKKMNGDLTVIMGGPQATATAGGTLKAFPFIDYIFRGEAESNLPLFIEMLRQGGSKEDMRTILGLAFLDGKDAVITKDIGLLEDLDSLPFASYELGLEYNILKFDVGRGCPFNCVYCSTKDFFGRRYRMKSPERVVDELRYIRKRFGTRIFHMTHDCFTAKRDYVERFCDELMSKGLKIKWSCTTRIDCVDKELIDQMANAGCYATMYGIETGSQRMQSLIKKNLKIGDMDDAIKHAIQRGLDVSCNFIIGFPDEHEDDLDETLRTVLRAKTLGSTVSAHLLDVMPGTYLYNKHLAELKYDGCHFSHTISDLNEEEEKMVLDHPEIFSGFYYIESPSASRDQLISICSIINMLRHFPATTSNLSKVLQLPKGPAGAIKQHLHDAGDEALSDTFISFLKAHSEFLAGKEKTAFDIELTGFSLRNLDRCAPMGFKLAPEPENLIGSHIVKRDAEWDVFRKGHYYYAIVLSGPYGHDLFKITPQKYQILKEMRDGGSALNLWKKIDERLKSNDARFFWSALFANGLICVEEKRTTDKQPLKVLLIPPNPGRSDNGRGRFVNTGLLSIVAALREMENVSVDIYNAPLTFKKEADLYHAIDHIVKKGPDVLGFSAWCHTYTGQILLAKHIKTRLPRCKIIFGGPHASSTDLLTMKNFSEIDFVIRGEAERALPKLLKCLSANDGKISSLKDIPNLTYRNGKNIVQNEIEIIKDLGSLPEPAYDLLKLHDVIPLDIGRGCPYKCSFCSTSAFFGRKFRMRSADRVIKEMKDAHHRFGPSIYAFLHDNFTVDRDYLKLLCHKLKRSGISPRWSCMSRTDNMDKETLKLFKTSGCDLIGYGLETGSEDMQKKIHKNLNLGHATDIAAQSKKAGIGAECSIIIGYPQETHDDLNKSLMLFLELLNSGVNVNFNILSALPGTEIYDRYKNDLLFDGFSTTTHYSDLLKEEKELIEKYPEIFSSFYYLPTMSVGRADLILLFNIALFSRQYLYTTRAVSHALDLKEKKDLISIYRNWTGKEGTVRRINRYGLEKALLYEMEKRVIPSITNDSKKYSFLNELFALEQFIDHIDSDHLNARSKLQYDPYPKEPEIYLQNNWGLFSSTLDLVKMIRRLEGGGIPSTPAKRGRQNHYLISLKDRGDFGYNGFNITKITRAEIRLLTKVPKKLTRNRFHAIAGKHIPRGKIDGFISMLKKNKCIRIVQ